MDISQMTLDELHAEWEKIKPTIEMTLVPRDDKPDLKVFDNKELRFEVNDPDNVYETVVMCSASWIVS